MQKNYTFRAGVLIGCLFGIVCVSNGQKSVAGKVYDSETGEVLPGVSLTTARGRSSITDADGRYRIILDEGDTLHVSYVGFDPQSHPAQRLADVTDIRLRPGVALGEVTVTASIASARSTKAIGADVDNVDVGRIMERTNASSLTDVLDGRVSGVQLFQSNGKVGMPIRFNMRSGATLSMDRDPIIYVDGVRYNNSHTSDINTSQDALSALNDLPVEEIASIDVIKGPAAAASYGAEAANGVIVITTKRQGSARKGSGPNLLSVNAKLTYGVSTLARRYTQFVNNEAINKFFVAGHQTSAHASLAKPFGPGNRLYFSINANRAGGIIPGNTDRRYTLRAAYDLKQGPFTLNVSASYVNGDISIPQTAQGRNDAIWNLMRTQEPWQYVSERTWRAQSWSYGNDRFIGSARAGYLLPADIKFEVLAGLDVNAVKGIYLLPYGYLLGTNDRGQKNVSDRRNANSNLDLKLSRQFALGNGWSLTATLLSQAARRYESMRRIQVSGFSGNVDNVAAASERQVYETNFEQRTWGLYAEAFVNWQNRLFVNAGLRRDASNLIGSNVASILYPSLSISYNTGGVKLRTAYGESGRLPHPTDARTAYAVSGTSAYGPLVMPSTLGNPNIRPERMREIELGVDLTAGRHQISLTGYAQFTSDAIVYVPQLASQGWVGSRPENIGRVNGFGAELSWNGNLYRSSDAATSLDLFATVNWQTNRVIDTGGKPIENLPNVLRSGLPAYAFYYKTVVGASYKPDGTYAGGKESDEHHYLGKPFADLNGAFGVDLRLFHHLTIGGKVGYALGASVYNQSFYNVAGLGDNLKRRHELQQQLAAATVGTDSYRQVAEQLARTERLRANYIEPADFIRLSSLSVGYDLSNLVAKATQGTLKSCRLTLTAHNLLLITSYSGAEPQIEANGGTRQTRGIGSLSRDITNAPAPRSVVASVAFDF